MADSAPEIRGCAPAMSSPGGAMEVKPDSEQFKIKKCVSRRRILVLIVTKRSAGGLGKKSSER